MKPKQIVLLLIVAVGLLALAKWSGKKRTLSEAVSVDQPLLPGLELSAVAACEISGDNGTVLRLVHEGDVWVATNAFNYPLDISKLRTRLMALTDLKSGQLQRGMKLESGNNVVTLFDDKGAKLTSLILGPRRQAAQPPDDSNPMANYGMSEGRYVMRDGSDEVRLIKDSLDDWNSSVTSWLDTQLLNIPAADIATIEMRDGEGNEIKLDRSSGSLKLEGLDEEKENFDSSKSYGIESAFNYLRFNSVADPALDEDATGIASGSQFNVTLKNGERYSARIGATPEGGSDRYLKLAVSLPPATTNDAARAEQEKRVAGLTAKLSPWTYLISSYSASNMTHSRTNLVTIKEAETNAPAAEVESDLNGDDGNVGDNDEA